MFTASAAAGDPSEVDSRSVHVGNLDFKTKEEDLQQHFVSCGHVSRVTIIMDKATGKPKGFAYVQFTEATSVEVAVALAGTQIHNRPITVRSLYYFFGTVLHEFMSIELPPELVIYVCSFFAALTSAHSKSGSCVQVTPKRTNLPAYMRFPNAARGGRGAFRARGRGGFRGFSRGRPFHPRGRGGFR